MIYRSYGILSYARIMASREAMEHLSNVRLGWEMGILTNDKLRNIFNLMIDIQPANIQRRVGRDLNEEERDIERAKIIRDYIENLEG